MGGDIRILLTGFDAFPGQDVNPTAQMMRDIDGAFPDLFTRILPTEYRAGIDALDRALAEIKPQIVVCFGVAARSSLIRLELMAHNEVNTRLPDASGFVPGRAEISQNGAPLYMSTLPLENLAPRLNASQLFTQFSRSAGDYVCNYAFYHLMERRAARSLPGDTGAVAGFVHVPVPDGPARLSQADLCEAARIIVQTCRNHCRANIIRIAGARLDDPHPL